MAEAQSSSNGGGNDGSHLPPQNGYYGQHTDGLEHHEFEHSFENPPHHSLSPFSMNIGTLSRPASMGNFSLPPTSLSRVGSLSNMQNLHVLQHPMPATGNYFYNHPGFFPQFPQQQQQQGSQGSSQQGHPNSHINSNFVPVISNDFRLIDFSTGQPIPSNSKTKKSSHNSEEKSAKKSKKRTGSTSDSSTKAYKQADEGIPAPPKDQKSRSKNPSSVFRGVSKCSKDGRWQARIRVKRQVTYLGRFVNEEDAAKRYDEAAREHHGDKAVLNFPTQEDKELGRKQATSALGVHGADGDLD